MQLKKLGASVGIAAGLGVGAFAIAIPALSQPTAAAASCSGNLTCTYANYNYESFLGSRAPGTGLQDISSGARNKLSSWINYTSTGARFYYSTGGRGTCVSMYARDRATVHPGDGNPDNDQAESWAFTRSC